MRRSASATASRASSVSSAYRGDGTNSVGSDNGEGGSSLYDCAPDKALSQLSLNPNPSVDDLLAAGGAASGGGTSGKLSPKNGENTGSEGGVSSATVGAISQSPHRTTPTTKLRVKIKRYHAVARWTWNVAGVNPADSAADDGSTVSSNRHRMSVDFPPDEEEEVCTICQSAFEGTAPGTKFPGDECPVVWGKCGHSFHLSCVSTWLADKTTCPYCRAEWEFGADQPVDRSDEEEEDEEDGDDGGEADTSGERSGNTIRRRQEQYPTFEDTSDEEEEQSDGGRGQDEEVEAEEEEDDFWDSNDESYENERDDDEEESDSEVDDMDDSENDASRSSSPLFDADSSESSESIGDGGLGRSYRYATP